MSVHPSSPLRGNPLTPSTFPGTLRQAGSRARWMPLDCCLATMENLRKGPAKGGPSAASVASSDHGKIIAPMVPGGSEPQWQTSAITGRHLPIVAHLRHKSLAGLCHRRETASLSGCHVPAVAGPRTMRCAYSDPLQNLLHGPPAPRFPAHREASRSERSFRFQPGQVHS